MLAQGYHHWSEPLSSTMTSSLQWHHNERDSVSNHRCPYCLLSLLFRRGTKKTSKLGVTGLCDGNPPVTGGFHSQRTNNAENVSKWWRHHHSLPNNARQPDDHYQDYPTSAPSSSQVCSSFEDRSFSSTGAQFLNELKRLVNMTW